MYTAQKEFLLGFLLHWEIIIIYHYSFQTFAMYVIVNIFIEAVC